MKLTTAAFCGAVIGGGWALYAVVVEVWTKDFGRGMNPSRATDTFLIADTLKQEEL
jgi:hypothetical protein